MEIPALKANEGVRIIVSNDGLVCTWPRWDHDVQGVLTWEKPALDDNGNILSIPTPRWPALSADNRPETVKFPLPEGKVFSRYDNSGSWYTLGEGDTSVDVLPSTYSFISSDAPEVLMPQLSVLDHHSIKATKWQGYDAWEVKISMNTVAHPGEKNLERLMYAVPLTKGIAMISFSGTKQGMEQHRATIEKMRKGE